MGLSTHSPTAPQPKPIFRHEAQGLNPRAFLKESSLVEHEAEQQNHEVVAFGRFGGNISGFTKTHVRNGVREKAPRRDVGAFLMFGALPAYRFRVWG